MRSTLSVWAASLVESSWLVALVTTPIFYNVYSWQTFEPDKILLLRSLTALMLAALIVWSVESGRAAWTIADRPVWRVPLVQPVCALTAAYVLSTVLSIAPQLSLRGSYQRMQGTYTWLAYVTVFFSVVLVARAPQQWERLVSVVLIASLPAALYGIIQHFNGDPIDWGYAQPSRITSTAGNPIFLAGYLLMVVPLSLTRIVSSGRKAAAPYLLLLGLQICALYYAESRGPTVGLAYGLAAFIALVALLRGVRWPVFVVGGVAAFALLAVMVSRSAQRVRGPARLAQIFAWEEGSARERVLIWQGISDLLRRDPARAALGHGPETLVLALAPVQPAEMATYMRPDTPPDRAHNETLDALEALGAIGCGAQLILFVALFFHILRWLGVTATPAQRNWFAAAATGGATVGGLLPAALGRTPFAALGLSVGLATGVLAYLGVAAARRAERRTRLRDDDALLLAALFAAAIGHFVEIQVGISIATTRLYFFTFAGLAVAIGMQTTVAVTRDTHAARARPAVLGGGVGLLLILLTSGLYTPVVVAARDAAPLALLFLAPWVLGAVLVSGESPRRPALVTYVVASTVPWLLFVSVFVPWVDGTRPLTLHATSSEALSMHLAGSASFMYGAVFALLLLLAAALAWRQRGASGAPAARWQAVAVALPLLGVTGFVGVANLRLSRADCLAKLGEGYAKHAAWSEAVSADERAVQWAPGRQEYLVNLSGALMERARAVAPRDPLQRDADAARAIEVIQEAARADPLNPNHRGNLARLYHKWARMGDPAKRAERFEQAEAAYKQALALWPQNVVLWNELAVLYVARGQVQQMLDTFEQSIRLNDNFAETYVRRAQVFVALRRFDDAIADYRRARHWGRGYNIGRIVELYQATGQTDRALAEAQAGLADASAEELPNLRILISKLERVRGQPPGAN